MQNAVRGGASAPLCVGVRLMRGGVVYSRPCVPRPCATRGSGALRLSAPAWPAHGYSRPHALHASAGEASPAIGDAKAWPACVQPAPRTLRCASSLRSRSSECRASRRRAAPSTIRSRSPASWIARRACPHGCDGFPRARIRRPACSAPCPGACRGERA